MQTEVVRVANILPDERSGKLACFLSDVNLSFAYESDAPKKLKSMMDTKVKKEKN